MNKMRKRDRAKELAKDALILLLTCSALWLAGRSQIFGPLGGILREENTGPETVQTESGARADAARPLRMAVNLQEGAETIRYGVQYDPAAVDALFQQTAGPLVEALSSAEAPERVGRRQWEEAQNSAPAVTFDFQGEVPLGVLSGWLSGAETTLTAPVRRLTLAPWQEGVALFYRDEGDGLYYRCPTRVVSSDQLAQTLAGLRSNGAHYAFESETYRQMDPDTLLLEDQSTPAVYTASNPTTGGQSALEGLMENLGIPVSSSSFYTSGDEEVARSGYDMLRLSDNGVLTYIGGEHGEASFPVQSRGGSPTLFDSVEACRQAAAAAILPRCGEARLYLMSARETDQGLEVLFGYSLNGAVVRAEGGCAARFLVREGNIVYFTLSLRSYTAAGETALVPPLRQAAAAMEAEGLAGGELLLTYMDGGGDRVFPSWAAVQRLETEGG